MGNVRKQMEDNDFNKGFKDSAEETSDIMKGMLISLMILNIFMAGSMGTMV